MGQAIELVHVLQREAARGARAARVPVLGQVLDEHAELRPPIPHMVLADYAMIERFQRASQGVTDDGAAQVTDVHLLGHVGTGVIDDHSLGCGRRSQPDARVGHGLCGASDQEVISQRQVDESRPRNGGFLADVLQASRSEDLAREVGGRPSHRLCQPHGSVGLVVTKAAVGRAHARASSDQPSHLDGWLR